MLLEGLKGGSGGHVERNRKRERNIGQRIAPFQEKLCESWNPAGDSQARALREAKRQTQEEV